MTIINEANFNRLVMRSNVKHALEVQDWVCEVLGLDNASQALARLDDDEKADIIINDTSSNGASQLSAGGGDGADVGITDTSYSALQAKGYRETQHPYKRGRGLFSRLGK